MTKNAQKTGFFDLPVKGSRMPCSGLTPPFSLKAELQLGFYRERESGGIFVAKRASLPRRASSSLASSMFCAGVPKKL